MAQVVDLIRRQPIPPPHLSASGTVQADELPPHVFARMGGEPRARNVPQHPLQFRGREAADAGANGLDQAVHRAAFVFSPRPLHNPPTLHPAAA